MLKISQKSFLFFQISFHISINNKKAKSLFGFLKSSVTHFCQHIISKLFHFQFSQMVFKIDLCILRLGRNWNIILVRFLKYRLSIIFFRLNNRLLVRIFIIIFFILCDLNILTILIFVYLSVLALSYLLALWL